MSGEPRILEPIAFLQRAAAVADGPGSHAHQVDQGEARRS